MEELEGAEDIYLWSWRTAVASTSPSPASAHHSAQRGSASMGPRGLFDPHRARARSRRLFAKPGVLYRRTFEQRRLAAATSTKAGLRHARRICACNRGTQGVVCGGGSGGDDCAGPAGGAWVFAEFSSSRYGPFVFVFSSTDADLFVSRVPS